MTRGAPERSCVACRTRAPKHELLRFVVGPDDAVVFDGLARLPGRGVYTCPTRRCLVQAVSRHGFERGFRRKVTSGMGLVDRVGAWAEGRLLDLLGLTRRAGRLLVGSEVEGALGRRAVGLVVLARDLSRARGERILEAAQAVGVPVVVVGTKETLGRSVGRGDTGILGVPEGPHLAASIRAAALIEEFEVPGGQAGTQGPPDDTGVEA